jgi:hypothetical protein
LGREIANCASHEPKQNGSSYTQLQKLRCELRDVFFLRKKHTGTHETRAGSDGDEACDSA